MNVLEKGTWNSRTKGAIPQYLVDEGKLYKVNIRKHDDNDMKT